MLLKSRLFAAAHLFAHVGLCDPPPPTSAPPFVGKLLWLVTW
jgi:hypothetical protein